MSTNFVIVYESVDLAVDAGYSYLTAMPAGHNRTCEGCSGVGLAGFNDDESCFLCYTCTFKGDFEAILTAAAFDDLMNVQGNHATEAALEHHHAMIRAEDAATQRAEMSYMQ